jgi:hypothetical protein
VAACKSLRVAQKNIKYDILREEGKGELEFILSYLCKKYNVKMGYNLQHIGVVLLIFMMPCEVYSVLDIIIERTQEIFREKRENKCHWYVCFETHHYVVQVSLFFKVYLEANFRKKRSLLEHCKNIHFDLTWFVDKCMRFFLCDFLPLPAIIEFTFLYLTEGMRTLYRYIYAICRVNKQFIKSMTDSKTLLE